MSTETKALRVKRRIVAIKRHVGNISDFRFFCQGKSARISLAESNYQRSSWGITGQYPLCNLNAIGVIGE